MRATIYAARQVIVALLFATAAAAQPTWTQTFQDTVVKALAIKPGTGGKVIFAGTREDEGIYRSIDGGVSWTLLAGGPNPLERGSSAEIGEIYWLPSDTSVMLVASRNPRVGVYRSTDGGFNWARTLEFVSLSGESMFQTPNGYVYLGEGALGALWRSTDLGLTWDSVGTVTGHPDLCTLSPMTGSDNTFLAGSSGGAISRTTDSGKTWTTVYQPDTIVGFADVPYIVFDPTDSRTVLATRFQDTQTGLIKSTDGGLTWRRVEVARDQWALEIDKGNPMNMWMGRFSLFAQGPHLAYSSDAGETWQSWGFDKVEDIWMIKHDAPSGRIAMATSRGVFVGVVARAGVRETRRIERGACRIVTGPILILEPQDFAQEAGRDRDAATPEQSAERLSAELYSADGRRVAATSLAVKASTNEGGAAAQIDVRALAGGLYFLRTSHGAGVRLTKVLLFPSDY